MRARHASTESSEPMFSWAAVVVSGVGGSARCADDCGKAGADGNAFAICSARYDFGRPSSNDRNSVRSTTRPFLAARQSIRPGAERGLGLMTVASPPGRRRGPTADRRRSEETAGVRGDRRPHGVGFSERPSPSAPMGHRRRGPRRPRAPRARCLRARPRRPTEHRDDPSQR